MYTIKLKEACQRKYDLLIEPMRARARELGYTLAVHGSIERDIDLIAVPWTHESVKQTVLAQAMREVIQIVNGSVVIDDIDSSAYGQAGRPGHKAHNRLVWSYHLGGGPYIDLSVMAPCTTKRKDNNTVLRWARTHSAG